MQNYVKLQMYVQLWTLYIFQIHVAQLFADFQSSFYRRRLRCDGCVMCIVYPSTNKRNYLRFLSKQMIKPCSCNTIDHMLVIPMYFILKHSNSTNLLTKKMYFFHHSMVLVFIASGRKNPSCERRKEKLR